MIDSIQERIKNLALVYTTQGLGPLRDQLVELIEYIQTLEEPYGLPEVWKRYGDYHCGDPRCERLREKEKVLREMQDDLPDERNIKGETR